MAEKQYPITLELNGTARTFTVGEQETPLQVLREKAGLTGAKKGCDLGECGACTVIMDGRAVNSCCVFAVCADGKRVETIEGIGTEEHPHPLQQAFMDAGAIQCGFCTPGFILTAWEILESGKEYTDAELRKLLSGHLCRCTGYQNIFRAVKKTMLRRLGKDAAAELVK